MHPSWQELLGSEHQHLDSLEASLADTPDITPQASKVMRAFEMPVNAVKVLIVGQDPYPEIGVAQGLAFAVKPGRTKLPASLRNMMTELKNDLPKTTATGNLHPWVDQGVLLLNRHLTARVGSPGAHAKAGWSQFTDAAIQALAKERGGHFVAMLWGSQARQLRRLLGDAPVVESAHPSPLSAYRGFFGSKPYSLCNQLLTQIGQAPIDWNC